MSMITSKAFPAQSQVDFLKEEKRTPIQTDVFSIYDQDQYSEGLISSLEEYINEQKEKKSNDLEANLQLLRMYKIYPENLSVSKVADVLIKSLMSLPDAHYAAALYLIPEDAREDETIKHIVKIGSMLEAASFQRFWSSDLSALKEIPGFEDCIRAFIVIAISMTYDCIPKSFLKKQLNLDDDELLKAIIGEEWQIEEDLVRIPPNGENQIRTKKFKENIEFSQMVNVVDVLSK